MPNPPAAEILDAELETLLARAGIRMPDLRRDAVRAAYADLRGQIALLHGRYGPAAEPANVFRLSPAEDK